MSAITTQFQIHPNPAPQGVRFITLDEAARRGGYKNVGSLRHRLKEWIPSGLARQEKLGPGKAVWMVREDADARFARVKFPEQIPFDMAAVPDEVRKIVLQRERIVHEWEKEAWPRACEGGYTREQAQKEYVDLVSQRDNIRLTDRTLRNWLIAYKAQGREGLVDQRKLRQSGSDDRFKPFLDYVFSQYLSINGPKLGTCYGYARIAAAAEGWEIPSIKLVQRAERKIPRQVVIKKRRGDKAFNDLVVPSASRDYDNLPANQIWNSDHHQLDVLCVDKETGEIFRPWLTSWMDLRSRKIVGHRIRKEAPNQNAVLLSFKDACLSHGVPFETYIDNGKDYDCWVLQGQTKWQRKTVKFVYDEAHVRGVFPILGIKVHHAKPYNAKAKPVERWHRTLCDQFSRFFPTYCGSTPDQKPEGLNDRLDQAPTLDELSGKFSTWLDFYHNTHHDCEGHLAGETPEEVFGRTLEVKRLAREKDLDLLIQRTSKPIKVGRNGVTWDGVTYGQGDALLFPWFGKDVYLRVDPEEITRATAWTVDDQIIGAIAANGKMPYGATREEYQRAEAIKKRVRQQTRQAAAAYEQVHLDVFDHMNKARQDRQEAARKNPPPPAPGPRMRPVHTFLDGQSDQVQKAIERLPLRLAAGAEDLTHQPNTPARLNLLARADELPDVRPARGASSLSLVERLGDE